MGTIKVGAFRWVPESVQGAVKDLRIRWALEELNLPYEEWLFDVEDTETPEYMRLHPFGQIPIYQEGDLQLFESGAILLHIAEKSEALMPVDPTGRARARAWMFAAFNNLEPYLLGVLEAMWANLDRPEMLEMSRERLTDLSKWLNGRDYLEGRFTVADLLMTSILGISKLLREDIVAQMPVVKAYRERCEARPAYKKALGAQLATFAKHTP